MRPDLPDELDDRAQDMWEPLLAIADLAEGDWPERARKAAVALSAGDEREDTSKTARLLNDIYTVFENGAGDRLRTADLIAHLVEIEESPWGDWYGKTISPHGLSKLLRVHRIKTMPVRVDGETVRGYKREQFTDAFARVLGVTSVTNVTSESPSQAERNASNACNAGDTGNGRNPIFGDVGYLDYVADVHRNGHITTREALQLERVHNAVLEAGGEVP
jgi:putative DNA primase/helicase